MTRLRTLHLINGLGTGGAERSLAELLPDLREQGIDPVVVVQHRRPEGVEQQVLDAGIDVAHVTGRLPRRARIVRALVRSRGIDLVHSSITEATRS